ncbi:ATP synthase subunit a [Capsulimonas corticalis]|uniref:ATP synthase subunit a n=1 Tax=Capsulimonas corticalis TaxID=2219043 RepID=A0A402CNX4_9BACT|nr:F0F1 ATP synthase subunit A [Capsulimonas corticalis]BDI33194.1 ATP synthase subunit a [Capsulimonas corticalis]
MPTEPLEKPELWTCVIYGVMVAAILIGLGVAAFKNPQRVPGRLQNIWEVAVDGLRNLFMGLLGPGGERHVPLVMTLFMYILFCNLLSVTPLRAPTANLSTNLGLAVIVFFYVQYWSIRTKGFGGYLKHFLGPGIIPLIPLFLLTEIVGALAQPLSLAMRLYGNIYGEDYIAYVVASVVNATHIPAQFFVYLLMLFTGVLQAFIFTLLSSAYIGIATADHSHDDDHGHGHESLENRVQDAAYVPSA